MSENSRRDFIRKSVTGVAATGVICVIGTGTANAALTSVRNNPQGNSPFGYPIEGFDLNQSKDLGYYGYKGTSKGDNDRAYTWKDSDPEGVANGGENRHCAAATFTAILGQLQDLKELDGVTPLQNNPYNNIPLSMMRWGSGGVVGFGSLCGTLNGAAAAIGLIASNADAKGFINDLMTWYSDTYLPIYAPAGSDPYTQSIANSNLCHASVTNWCLASGFASGSSERSERCARLSADVAGKAIELLNGSVAPGLGNPRDNNTVCGQCHYKGTDFAGGQYTRGKMNCTSCHVDLKKVSITGHKRKGGNK